MEFKVIPLILQRKPRPHSGNLNPSWSHAGCQLPFNIPGHLGRRCPASSWVLISVYWLTVDRMSASLFSLGLSLPIWEMRRLTEKWISDALRSVISTCCDYESGVSKALSSDKPLQEIVQVGDGSASLIPLLLHTWPPELAPQRVDPQKSNSQSLPFWPKRKKNPHIGLASFPWYSLLSSSIFSEFLGF